MSALHECVAHVLGVDAADVPREQPDLRGWEWRYLWQLTRSSALVTLTNRLTRGFSVSFSPNGTRLAVGGDRRLKGVLRLDWLREWFVRDLRFANFRRIKRPAWKDAAHHLL